MKKAEENLESCQAPLKRLFIITSIRTSEYFQRRNLILFPQTQIKIHQ